MRSYIAERNRIIDIIEKNDLSIRFQPVFRKDRSVFGYEALSGLKDNRDFPDIPALFRKASETDMIASLDFLCRENAVREASLSNITGQGANLFLNICPESICSPSHRSGLTDEIAERWGRPKERIILEITEESAIKNYELFKGTLSYYRDKGYKIAIDDFGVGYGGLKMLSIIRPDFIKVDRHFISMIDRESVNFAVVDSIVILCRRLNIDVVAEGIEREEELAASERLGIELFQGFHFGLDHKGTRAPAPAVKPLD